jgi:hypothetical protein
MFCRKKNIMPHLGMWHMLQLTIKTTDPLQIKNVIGHGENIKKLSEAFNSKTTHC